MKTIDGLPFLEYLKKKIMILDGAVGTAMLHNGMDSGACPEVYALEHADVLKDVQQRYIEAGARAIYAFTMGANALKLKAFGLERDVRRINISLAGISIEAAGGKAFVGGDMSTTGSFLAPTGDLELEQAIEIYKEQARALEDGGVDFIVIETMIDIREARAAVIAAKEACSLPVVACMTFDANGRTLTGTTPEAAAITLISAGADVVGLNCSTGPSEMLPLAAAMKRVASVPLIVKPNAGMPRIENGKTRFDLSCEAFRKYVVPLCEAGANLIGGCCGTDPEYIRAVAEEAQGLSPKPWKAAMPASMTSVSETMDLGATLRVIGNRISPEGDPKLKIALQTGDYYEVLDIALAQKDDGAHIAEIDARLPGIDEGAVLRQSVEIISTQARMPVCIRSSDPQATEAGLRAYPGRAFVRSAPAGAAYIKPFLSVLKRYRALLIFEPCGQSADEKIGDIRKAAKLLAEAGLDKPSMVVLANTENGDARETAYMSQWCADHGFLTALNISQRDDNHKDAGEAATGIAAVIADPSDLS
jgi:5-methyltetrahydrofolate--homocysteine methyltransferase